MNQYHNIIFSQRENLTESEYQKLMRSADTAKGVQVVETLFEVLEDRQIEHSEAVTELLEVE